MTEYGMRIRANAGKIIRNFGFLTIGKTIGDLFTFLLFVVISRTFGQEGIGEYSFAIGFTGFFVVFADFGLYSFSIKELSQHLDTFRQYYGKIWALRLALAIVVVIALAIASPFLPFSSQTRLIVFIVGIYQLIQRLVEGTTSAFIAHEEAHFVSLIDALFKAIAALIAITVSLLTVNLTLALGTLPISSALQLLLTYLIVSRRYGKPIISSYLSDVYSVLRQALPYGVSTVLYQVQSRVDVVLLGFLLGETASGIYNVGYRVIFLLLFIPSFASVALFPQVSKLYSTSILGFKSLYHKSLNTTVIIGIPFAAGLWLIAPGLIELLFGQGFMESSSVLRILSPMFFFTFMNRVMVIYLMASDNQNDVIRATVVVMLLNVMGNFVLIPILGVRGAALSSVVTDGMMMILFAWRLNRIIGWPHVTSRAAISVLGTCSFLVPFLILSSVSIVFIIPVAILIYVAVVAMFKEIRHNEMRMLMSFLAHRSRDSR